MMINSLLFIISTAAAIWIMLRLINYLPTKWQQLSENKTAAMLVIDLLRQPQKSWACYDTAMVVITTLSSLISVIVIGYQLTLITLLFFTWLLITVAVIDYQHMMIPDELNYTLRESFCP